MLQRPSTEDLVAILVHSMAKYNVPHNSLITAVVLSEAMTRHSIPNKVVVGYLAFSGAGKTMMRHAWVVVNSDGTIVDPFIKHVSQLDPVYWSRKPKGRHLLVVDEVDAKLLESVVKKMCTNKNGQCIVTDCKKVLEEIVVRSPSWLEVLSTLRLL